MTNEYTMGDMRHRPPLGWRCILRDPLHEGPCAAVPRRWNLSRAAREYRRAYRNR